MLVLVNTAQNQLQTENIDYLPPSIDYSRLNANSIACIIVIYR
jgi:hypothetical protein